MCVARGPGAGSGFTGEIWVREQVRFAVLGPVRAWRGTVEVDLGPPQQRAVLAVLLLAEGSQVRVGELVDAVWGTEPVASATGSIRTYVHRLRRRLDPAVIRSMGDGYVVRVSPEELDVAAFRDLVAQAEQARRAGDAKDTARLLRDALGLWRGTALAGIRGEYAQAQRERLGALRLSALEARLAAELDLGAHTDVATELAGLVAEHPLDERFLDMLMLALYRSGRQAAALAAYREGRTLLADELGVDPGPGLQRTYERILRADPGLLAPDTPDTPDAAAVSGVVALAPAAPVVAPALPVPAQLPADLPVFVGRDTQLAQVGALLPGSGEQSPTVVVSAIGGAAGVGKTTFAVHWARRVAARFPDGQIHLNLRGFDPAGPPVSPEHALRSVLESLGVAPGGLPQGVDALSALYRTLLADRRVLLLLDNARDAQQVRPLLPASPGCLVIVTSRDRLSGLVATEGAHPVHLDVLSVDEAHDLLARRLGHDRVAAEPEAVQEIIERCARLPLALAVAAARAIARSAFPLAVFAAELRDSQGSLEAFSDTEPDSTADVRAVFSWSYHALTPAAARLFRLLALHPGPDTSLPAAASLGGLTVAHTRQLLAELVRAHLVDEPAPGRYASHDLLRAYGTELAHTTDPPAEHHAARLRVLDHCLHSAHRAGTLYSPGRCAIVLPALAVGVRPEEFTAVAGGLDSSGESAAWFAAEQAVLLAAVGQAAAHGFETHTWQLAWAIEHYLDRRGLWRDLEAVHRTAMDAALRLRDRTAQAHAHRGLARATTDLGRVDEARVHMERAIELFAETADMAACAESLRQLSWVAERQGDLEAALDAAQRSLAMHRAEQAGGKQTAGALNAVGWYHTLLGQHEQALEHCREALALLQQEPGYDYGEADIWDSIGYAHHHLGQYEEAVTAYRNALALYRRVDVPYAEADTMGRLGDTHLSAGRPQLAHAEWSAALHILERLDHADADCLRAKLRELPEPDGHRVSPFA